MIYWAHIYLPRVWKLSSEHQFRFSGRPIKSQPKPQGSVVHVEHKLSIENFKNHLQKKKQFSSI